MMKRNGNACFMENAADVIGLLFSDIDLLSCG